LHAPYTVNVNGCSHSAPGRWFIEAGVVFAALVIGCGKGSQSWDGPMGCQHTAPGEKLTSSTGDQCGVCVAQPCAPTDRCASEFQSGGPVESFCACVDGYMGCCQAHVRYLTPDASSKAYVPAGCDYGPLFPPGCPATPPGDGDPCDAPNACGFFDPCCAGPSPGGTGFCVDGKWSVACWPPIDGTSCTMAATGARCDQTAGHDGTAFACRCDVADGGTPTWHCGPDV